MPESIKHVLTLTVICLITASLLTGVYFITQPKIIEQKAQEERQALKEVLPEAGYFEAIESEGKDSYYRAYSSSDKKKLLGYAFRTKARGYSSEIETIAGMNTQGRITGVKILAQNETPGLGARINEVLVKKTLWHAIKEFFSWGKISKVSDKPWFCVQFEGKKIEDLEGIQAITGATISSQALTDSVCEKAEEVRSSELGVGSKKQKE